MNIIKKHTTFGFELLNKFLPVELPRIPSQYHRIICDVANCHQERIDGMGYAHHINGSQISLPARICAIADTYDAIVADRPYRKRKSHEYAIETIISVAGTQLDTCLVQILTKNQSWAS